MTMKKSKEQWVSEVTLKHKGKYDYSLVEYVNAHTKVKIMCPDHGLFEQKPSNHLNGQNCPFCAQRGFRVSEDFEKASRRLHGEIYDYSKVKYLNNKTKVEILCKEHGSFWQVPNSHLTGRGCPKCGIKRGSSKISLSKNDFVARSISINKDRYDYSNVVYVNNRTKVKIVCRQHGAFLQTPDSHLSGQGCPKCSKMGFNFLQQGFVYFIISEDGCYIKVGISGNVKRRLEQLRKVTPFNFSVLKVIKAQGDECKQIEESYLSQFEPANRKGFNGCTEWLKYSKELMSKIMGA